jgi:hypothetical protein
MTRIYNKNTNYLDKLIFISCDLRAGINYNFWLEISLSSSAKSKILIFSRAEHLVRLESVISLDMRLENCQDRTAVSEESTLFIILSDSGGFDKLMISKWAGETFDDRYS